MACTIFRMAFMHFSGAGFCLCRVSLSVGPQQSASLEQQLHEEGDGGAHLSDAHHQQLTTKEQGLQWLLQACKVRHPNGAAGDHECIENNEEQGQAGAVVAILRMLQQQVRNHTGCFVANSICECCAVKPCTPFDLTSKMLKGS